MYETMSQKNATIITCLALTIAKARLAKVARVARMLAEPKHESVKRLRDWPSPPRAGDRVQSPWVTDGVLGFVQGTIMEVLNPNPCSSPPPHNPNPKPYNPIQPRPRNPTTRYNPRPQPYNPIQPQPPTL